MLVSLGIAHASLQCIYIEALSGAEIKKTKGGFCEMKNLKAFLILFVAALLIAASFALADAAAVKNLISGS
jgi:hypothetical protein